jgi:hypothetical protein
MTLNSAMAAVEPAAGAAARSNSLLTSFHSVVGAYCKLCVDDDAAADAMTVFQESFCDKIKNSASANLRSANMCSVTVVADEGAFDATK